MKRKMINIALYLTGRPAFQPFWKFLHRVSLAGMNYGRGGSTSESGEHWLLDSLLRLAKEKGPLVFFDVGANVGDYSVEIINKFGQKVSLYSFEPSSLAFSTLESRLGGYPNVQLFNFGLGEKEESATLCSPEAGLGIASVYRRRLDHFGVSMNHTEEIKLRTLDSFCN